MKSLTPHPDTLDAGTSAPWQRSCNNGWTMAVQDSEIARSLKAHPFVEGFPADHIDQLVRCARLATFQAGVYLLRQGEHSDGFYLLQSGHIALEIAIPGQGALQIETIGGGEVLGWSWIVEPYRLHFDVRVVNDVRAIVLDGDCLRQHCEQDPAFGYGLLKRLIPVIGHRLQSTRLKLFELYGGAMASRARVRS